MCLGVGVQETDRSELLGQRVTAQTTGKAFTCKDSVVGVAEPKVLWEFGGQGHGLGPSWHPRGWGRHRQEGSPPASSPCVAALVLRTFMTSYELPSC